MIKRALGLLFYDPYKFVAKHRGRIAVGKSILDKTFKVRFDDPDTRATVRIGDDSILRCNLVFESNRGRIDIGDRVFINAGTSLISRTSITIGDDVTIAWGCTVYDHDSHSLDHRERVRDQEHHLRDWNSPHNMRNKNWDVVNSKPIVIGNHAWLGFNVVVLKGVTIGEGAVIGACSVVASDIEPWCVAVGNPARVVKRINRDQPE